jgi:hypothetical protein
LEEGTTVDGRRKKDIDEGKLARPVVCLACGLVFSDEPACPACGWKPKHRAKVGAPKNIHEARDEVLSRYDATTAFVTAEMRQRYWMRCLYIAAARGASLSSAAQMFRRKFALAAWDAGVEPMAPAGATWKLPAAEVFPQLRRRGV